MAKKPVKAVKKVADADSAPVADQPNLGIGSKNKSAWKKSVAQVPLTSIVLGKNSRKDLGNLATLTKDIRQKGLLTALSVIPGKKAGTYELVCGYRRFQVVTDLGFKDVPILIDYNIKTEVDKIAANVSENSTDSRFALAPLDEAAAFRRMMDADSKLQPKDIASRCGCSDQHVRARLSLLSVPKAVQAALNDRRIGVGAAEALSRIEDAKVRDRIIQETDLEMLTEKTVKARANQIAAETGAQVKKREGAAKKGDKTPGFKLSRTKKEMETVREDALYKILDRADADDEVAAAFFKGVAATAMYFLCDINAPIKIDDAALLKAIDDMDKRSQEAYESGEKKSKPAKKTAGKKPVKPVKVVKLKPVKVVKAKQEDKDDFSDDDFGDDDE